MLGKTLSLLLLTGLLIGCQASGTTTLPHVDFDGHRYYVDIADDDRSRARGLMFVDEMDANRGMFFIFRREAPRSFWMRNTRIPLDIIYLDRELRVVSISETRRRAEPSVARATPARGRPSTYSSSTPARRRASGSIPATRSRSATSICRAEADPSCSP